MSAKSESASDCDPLEEEAFEDALESIKTTSNETDSSDSDDTELLTTDFELLGLSSPDEGAKSPVESRESGTHSTDSWEKCDAGEILALQDVILNLNAENTLETTQEIVCESPIAHCSRDIQPITETLKGDHEAEDSEEILHPKKGVQVKTAEEWKSIVEKYTIEKQMEDKLHQVQLNLNKLRVRPEEFEHQSSGSSSTSTSSNEEESDDEDETKRKEISAMIREMMQHSRKKRSPNSGNSVINRAASVVESLKTQHGDSSFEIVSSILEMLDRVTMDMWVENIVTGGRKSNLDEFVMFLRSRAKEVKDDNFETRERNPDSPGPCYCCKNYHKMFNCEFFRSHSIGNRWKMSKKSRLCTNCLQGRHPVRECRSANNCKICNKRHNTILHKSMEAMAKSRRARRLKQREAKRAQKVQQSPDSDGQPQAAAQQPMKDNKRTSHRKFTQPKGSNPNSLDASKP